MFFNEFCKIFKNLFLQNISGGCLYKKDELMWLRRAWCKSGTRTSGPGTRNPPQSLNVGPGTPIKFKNGTPGLLPKFKSGTPGLPTKFKSGTPSLFFNKFSFLEYFIVVSFLNMIQKYQL